MHKIKVVMILVLMSILSFAQEKEMKFQILNEQNIPMKGVIVLLKKESNIISFYETDKEGIVLIKQTDTDSLILEITEFGYYPLFFDLEYYNTKNGVLQLILYRNDNLLEEIVIKKNIYDTDLQIETLNLSHNNTLRDALSRSSKVRIEGNDILYNNKSINKILINDKEAFVYQNKQALDELKVDLLEKVEVMDKYNDEFTLSFEKSDEAVLNIITKKQNVMVPSAHLGYGLDENYKISGALYSFGNHNLGITTNTNNIENISIDPRAFNKIYRRGNQIKEDQNDRLRSLFSENKNSTKSFLTNNTFSFRKSTNTIKTGLYISYNKIKRTVENQKTIYDDTFKEADRLKSEIARELNGNHFLIDAPIAIKTSENSLLEINTMFNTINQKDTDLSKTVVNNELIERTIDANNEINNSINKLKYSRKINHTIIISYTTMFETYNSINKSVLDRAIQTKYNSNRFKNTASINNKINDKLNIFSTLEINYEKETAENELFKKKKIVDYEANIRINSNNLFFENLISNISFGVTKRDTKHDNKGRIPFLVELKYSKRKNFLFFDWTRTINTPELLLGINHFDQNNNFIKAINEEEIKVYSEEKIRFKYSYNDFIKQLSFGVGIEYLKVKDKPRIGIENINFTDYDYYYTFINPMQKDVKASSFVSKQFLDQYPIKTAYQLSLSKREGAVENRRNRFLSRETSYISTIIIESFSNKKIDFFIRSILSLEEIKDSFLKTKYKTFNNLAKLKIKYAEKWFFNLDFQYDIMRIKRNSFERKNFHLSIDYYLNKKIALSIISNNIDEFVGLFDNSSYYNIVETTKGLNTVTTYPKALKYLLLTLKYNL